jgi:hypothetical protein
MPENEAEKDLKIEVSKEGKVSYGKDVSFADKFNYIQQNLKAPKAQVNTFGGFNYRSCEDIVEALKPLLGDLVLLMNDEIVLIGERYYVKATVSIEDHRNGKVSAVAYARETESKTKMDDAQITGGSSSYARKYALNGLLAIDDSSSDPDRMDNTKKAKTPIIRGSDGRGVVTPQGDLHRFDDDPIMKATAPRLPNPPGVRCELCGAVGRYHKKGCPNA